MIDVDFWYYGCNSIVQGRRINDAEIIAKDLKEAKLKGLIKESSETGSDDWETEEEWTDTDVQESEENVS